MAATGRPINLWVTANGKWYTDEFLEAWGPECVDGGDCEPMSDKQSRYSHVSIIESSPARAVVHWRYAFAGDRNYKGAFQDPKLDGLIGGMSTGMSTRMVWP